MRIVGVLGCVIACGGSSRPPPVQPVVPVGDPALAFGAKISLPAASDGVAPTVRFGEHVRVRGTTVEVGTGGAVTGTRAPVRRRVVGTREAAQAGDTIVFVESTTSSQLVVGLVAASAHPTVLAVRQLGGRDVAVLPYRFASVDDEPGLPASTIDVIATDAKYRVVPATGTAPRHVSLVPWTTPSATLSSTLEQVAQARPIARVRITSAQAELPAQHLVDVIAAAGDAGAPVIELQDEPRAALELGVTLGPIAAAAGVQGPKVRQAIFDTGDALLECYERASFTTPTLEGAVTVEARVAAGGQVDATVSADLGAEMGACVKAVFDALKIDRVRSAGRFTATIDLTRTPAPK